MDRRINESGMRQRFEKALLGVYGTAVNVEKLHGSIYQSGLPDSMLFWHTGEILLIEYKAGSPKTIAQVIELLQGRQRLVLMRLGVKRAHAWMLVRSREDVKDSERCWSLVWAGDLVVKEGLQREVAWTSLENVIMLLSHEVNRMTKARATK